MGKGGSGGAARHKAHQASAGTKSRKAAREEDRVGAHSKAKVILGDRDASPAEQAETMAHIRAMIGRDVTRQDIASLVGAPDGSTVYATSIRSTSIRFRGIDRVEILVEGGGVSEAQRTLTREGGAPRLSNDLFFASETGTGLGTKVFARQVHHAARLGVRSIVTDAARRDGPGGMNGYYTWARLGYNARLTPEVRAKLPAGLRRARSVNTLMKTEQGREFWKEHGIQTKMSFNLRPGSRSRRSLAAYLEERGFH